MHRRLSVACLDVSFSRATAEELLKEYKACESADYITYVGPWFVRSHHS